MSCFLLLFSLFLYMIFKICKKLHLEKVFFAVILCIMNHMKLLSSAVIGTFIYVIVSFFLGPEGYWATSQMNEQKRIIQENLQSIQQLNDSLTIEYTSLAVDSDVIASKAKSLGYISDGEKLMKFTGLDVKTEYVPLIGEAIVLKPIQFVPEWICKLCGFVSFAFFSLLFLLKRSSVSTVTVTKEHTVTEQKLPNGYKENGAAGTLYENP